ncbi:HNH endonuclease [Clostridium sp. BSD9I1]|uniref:HNH endonuclease n=1 Tax=Clostridium sp. BSD9I1 TaxID=2003589 RepID=UPI00164403F9|nr:HNH endonuclease [Clostridium sp. BSD9I1]
MNIYNQDEVGAWISKLIAENRLEEFYNSKYWRKLRKEVLAEHKGECQICKSRGFYTEANTVHHVQYVRKHPRLALSKTYIFQGKEYKNLIPLCHDCHEEVHGYRQKEKKKPLTEERW